MIVNKYARFLLLVLSCLFLLVPTGTVWADYYDDPAHMQKVLDRLSGDWYNNGKLVLSIHDNYLNDCQIVKVMNIAGGGGLAGGQLRIIEDSGYRDLKLSWRIFKDRHDHITFNNQVLHKADNGYYESVGGVYLDMPYRDVLSTLGSPDNTENLRYGGLKLYYYNKGLTLVIRYDEVNNITLLKGGTAHFDSSGFNCNDSLSDYFNQYGLKGTVVKGIRQIDSTGEYFFFPDYPEKISLSTYPN